jgi:transcription initiation factor TFIIE subunit alpha
MYDPNEEKKDFFCPRCKMQYTQLEVLPLMSPSTGFDCGRCGNPLEREERGDGASTGTEMSTRFANQIGPFVDMLRKIDDEIIPANDFDTAFSMALPVQRNEDTDSKAVTVPLAVPKGLPTTVKGITQVVAGPLDVVVTSSAERTAVEKVAEAKRKAAIAAQNTLPEWHAKSTVTGESVAVRKDGEQQVNGALPSNEDDEDQKDGNKLDDELTAYYAQMAQEAEIEKQKGEEPDSDDEEEDDFEDVGIGATAIGTPSSSMSGDPTPSREAKPNGILKRKESSSGSSAPVTDTHTPAASGAAVDEEEGPAAKKVKFESQGNGVANGKVERSAAENQDKDSDEDDEAEFEDAL